MCVGYVQGHKNFAHCLINIFPAVQNCISQAGSEVSLWASSGPHSLGDVEKIFPELSFSPLRKEKISGFHFFHEVLVPLGVGKYTYNIKIQEVLRRRVLDHAYENCPEDTQALVKSVERKCHDYVLWVSVRGHGERNARNFLDALGVLALLLIDNYDNPAIIFDGLSIQYGYSFDNSVRGEVSYDQVCKEKKMVNDFVEKFDNKGCSFYSAIGVSLADSFVISEVVTGYFCHDGSLQHKIGWVRPEIPGIIHGNHQRNRGQGKGWHPVEGGYAPKYIPPECVIDLKENDSPVSSANYPYEFVNFEKLKSFMGYFFEDSEGFVQC